MQATQIETPDGLTLQAREHASSGPARGTVLQVHGITQDMDEGGMFVRLADCLTEAGFNVVRFTFRGHGDSDGTPRGVTIAGERLDFESAFRHTKAAFDGAYFVVAKSFGAVSTCCSLEQFEDDLSGLVLWNPVLDIDGTFLTPTVQWGIRNFSGENLATLSAAGYVDVDGRFEMGAVLYDELSRYEPGARFVESSLPALVIHGDADSIVPYEDVADVAATADADFHTIENGDHGFVRPDVNLAPETPREHDERTVEWLTARADDTT